MAINVSGSDIAYMRSIGYKIVPNPPEPTSWTGASQGGGGSRGPTTPPGTVWMERNLSLPYNPPSPSNNPSSAWEIKPATTTTTMPNQPSNLDAIQAEINRIAQEVGKVTTGTAQLTGKPIPTGTASALQIPQYQPYTGNIDETLGRTSFHRQSIADEEAKAKRISSRFGKGTRSSDD